MIKVRVLGQDEAASVHFECPFDGSWQRKTMKPRNIVGLQEAKGKCDDRADDRRILGLAERDSAIAAAVEDAALLAEGNILGNSAVDALAVHDVEVREICATNQSVKRYTVGIYELEDIPSAVR